MGKNGQRKNLDGFAAGKGEYRHCGMPSIDSPVVLVHAGDPLPVRRDGWPIRLAVIVGQLSHWATPARNLRQDSFAALPPHENHPFPIGRYGGIPFPTMGELFLIAPVPIHAPYSLPADEDNKLPARRDGRMLQFR